MSRSDDDRYENEPMDNRRWERAKSAVSVPATLLIVVGALSLIMGIWNIVQYPSIPGKMDEAIANIENNNNIPRDQKDAQINLLQSLKDVLENPVVMVCYIVNVICSFLVIFGGVRMLQLSGPAFPTISAVLSMIPCTVSCCCLLGLPAGIWALVVLSRPDIRVAMAARNSVEPPLDGSDLR